MKHLVWAALLSAALHAAVLTFAPGLKRKAPALSGSQAPVVVSLANRAAPSRESRPERTAAPLVKKNTAALQPPSRPKPEPPKPRPVVKKPAPKKAPPKPKTPPKKTSKAAKKKAVSRPVAAAPATAAPPETPPPVPKTESTSVPTPQSEAMLPAAAAQRPPAGPTATAPAGKSAPARDGIQSRLANSGESILKPAAPLYRRNPPPRYPRIAKSRGYQGKVLLNVLVGRNGRVLDVAVAASSGYRVLDKAALKAVADWLFEPGKKGQEAVEMWVKVPIRFEIK
jgi:protein TonB